MKKLLCIATLLAVQIPQLRAESTFWKGLNVFGGMGSAASLAYWTERALTAYVLSTKPGFHHITMGPMLVPRLALDAACIGASIYGNKKEMAPLAKALNIGCLLGSAYSLLYWAPVIMAYPTVPVIAARGIIDITQILLTLKRLYDASQETKEQ